MFRRFQMLKKGVETIKRVAPSVGSALGKKKVELLKKMGKTQRKSPENFKKAGGDKLKKEILAAETRVKKAEGGSMNAKNGMSSQVSKTILKGVADGVYSMDDFKRYKKTGEIPGSKKRTEKALGGMLGFKKKDKKKDKSIKEKILPKKKKDRLEELRKELKAKGGRAGEAQRRAGSARKEKRLNMALEKVYGQVADRSRKRLKKRGNIKIEDLEGKMKKDITEAAKAMGGYKSGGRAFGGGKR